VCRRDALKHQRFGAPRPVFLLFWRNRVPNRWLASPSSSAPVDAFTEFNIAPVSCGLVQLFTQPNVTQGNVGINAD
jgi:hypothetical protein